MINAKLEIDSLLKSNKVVIFSNEKRDPTSNRNNKDIKKRLKFNIDQTLDQELDKQIEIVQLLETYDISKEMISVINVNSFTHAQTGEAYLKAYYFSEQEIKVSFF